MKASIKKSKKTTGRPKGSKSGLPFTKFPEAINYAKTLWQKAQYNEMAFSDIKEAIGLKHQKAVRVMAHLRDDYGVVEKSGGNWRLTDAGKRVVKDEYVALKEVFTKNPIFADLYNKYGSTGVTEGVILEYIKKKYKGMDAEEVKKRLLEGKAIIEQNAVQTSPPQGTISIEVDRLPLFQLRYALKPPTDSEIVGLTDKVIKILKDSKDDTLGLLADLITEKKNDKKEVANLLDKAMKKLGLDEQDDKDERPDDTFQEK